MNLVSTNLKADAEKVQLAKLKGINLSQLFRDALDTSLRVVTDDKDMLESQLTEIRKQIEVLQLEEKLVLDQLHTLDSREVLDKYRESKYQQWKISIAYQINHKSIDWDVLKKLFRFSNVNDCKTWITKRLREENL